MMVTDITLTSMTHAHWMSSRLDAWHKRRNTIKPSKSAPFTALSVLINTQACKMLYNRCALRQGHVRASPTLSRSTIMPPSPLRPKPRHLMAVRSAMGDDSENMGRHNWEDTSQQPQEVMFTEQDIKEGNKEGSSAQEIGTEVGKESEQRSSGSSPEGHSGSQAQEMSQGADQPQGGRFDEEAVPGDHPYDPRPRERGHGIPPHKDSSNTGPAKK